MSTRHLCVLAMCVLTVPASVAAQQTASPRTVDFQREVRPILSDNCFRCHGPDQSTRQARLRLDTHDGAFAPRPNGTTIVPGDLEASLLYTRITHADERLRMPPPAAPDELLAIVLLVRVAVPSLKMPPPKSNPATVLPEIVLLMTVSVPLLL